jgi:hypothetical protein
VTQIYPSVLLRILEELAPWVSILVNVAGAVVAAEHLKRSRWMVLILIAFLVETAMELAFRFLVPRLGTGDDPSRIQAFLAVSSLLGVIGRAALVAGIAGLLSEWTKSSRTPQVTPGP